MSNNCLTLIVDNESDAAELLAMQLKYLGVESVKLYSGSDTLAYLSETSDNIQLIFLDLAMPKPDGYETCRQIRRDAGMVDVPIIAVTAMTGSSVESEVYEAGFTDIMWKPYKPGKLSQLLEMYWPSNC